MTTGGRTSSAAFPPTNAVSLKPIEVPQALQTGEKFIKWDEVSNKFFKILHLSCFKHPLLAMQWVPGFQVCLNT